MSSDRTFAFIIHPIDPKGDVGRRYPLLGKVLSEPLIHFFSAFWPPVYISEITGCTSRETGKAIKGWFVAAPYTPQRMLSLPVERVYRKIIATGHLAERLGANILGLGAFTAVIGDAGITIAERLDIPVTTGDSYTVTIVADSIIEAGQQMGTSIKEARVAIVGATGAIGSATAQLLSRQAGELILIGKREKALHRVRERCEAGSANLTVSTDLQAMHEADLILSVTSSISPIIHPEHLKPGAVVCDAAVPRDVSKAVAALRDDVLVIEGGMVELPGPVDFHFNFGYPQGKSYACMAETMALAMEGRFEDYTLGRDLEIEKVYEIGEIASRHGFRLSGLRSFEREVTAEHIARVRENALTALRSWSPAGSVAI
jgi:predicted amino acid dehydrogenase